MTTPSAARRALYRDVARARLQHHLPGRSDKVRSRYVVACSLERARLIRLTVRGRDAREPPVHQTCSS
jgi:hypothetical protein